ncbi:MAG: PGPGW domain-containing protein [Bryobacter sp.]|nr:PGPGW domain-containing protein [Bryobacter sp.]
MAKSLRILTGIFLCILGVLGIILPIMPGWIFLIPGLVILADHFHWARKLLDTAKAYYERAKAAGKKLD